MAEKQPISIPFKKGSMLNMSKDKKVELKLPNNKFEEKRVSVNPVLYKGNSDLNVGVETEVKTNKGVKIGVSKFGKSNSASIKIPIKYKK